MPMSDAHGSSSSSKDDSKLSPPSRRPANLNRAFDLEPNPFEQSFSNTRSSSSDNNNASGNDEHLNANRIRDEKSKDIDDSKPVLPSVAALSSPTDGYSWSDLAPGSLRAGPLSPAMLQGPQQHHQPGLVTSYDPTRPFGRTGLTPSTGLTPLVGGPISFPPPSPNTAAFLAMVTNQSNQNQNQNQNPSTVTPSAISAMLNSSNNNNSQPGGAIPPSATTNVPTSSSAAALSSSIPAISHPYSSYSSSAQNPNAFSNPSSTNAASTAANGLFLLSQAHQELTKREEAARADANAVSTARRSSKRKSLDAPPSLPPVTSSSNNIKRPRANSNRKQRDKSTADEDDSDDDDGQDDMMMGVHLSSNPNKKPETEEEKRKNFLERNRQAALKCRQRKKAWLAQLQARVEFLQTENERLTTALVSSREEISRLNALLGAGGPPPPGISNVNSQPVSVAVSLPSAGKSIAAPQIQNSAVAVSNGRGYGY